MANSKTLTKIFISYAIEDEAHKLALEKHLSALKRQGIIESFDAGKIKAGANWDNSIQQHLSDTDITLLLLSADALANDYIHDHQIQKALIRAEANETILIPILIRSVDYTGLGVEKYAVLPSNKKAVTEWNNQDKAYQHIAHQIRKVVENLSDFKSAKTDVFEQILIKDKKDPAPQDDKKTKIWNYIISFGVLIGILASMAEISGYSIKDYLSSSNSPDKFAYTVYLHNPKDELIEEIEGREVELDLSDQILDATIAEGQAHFKISEDYIGETAKIRIRRSNEQQQAYQNIHLDSAYLLTKEGKAKLSVILPGLDKLNGRVTDFVSKDALPNVRISINQHISTYSNEFGEFELLIPPKYQQKTQHIFANKQNYCDYNISIPIYTKDITQIALRPKRTGKNCTDSF